MHSVGCDFYSNKLILDQTNDCKITVIYTKNKISWRRIQTVPTWQQNIKRAVETIDQSAAIKPPEL